ncbi:uncharacterized protein LOC142772129 [Rhipicephalus microplus]|uniref:uncharacterized protein LOC142772129 n=1 Tax=Rhipicephalus microplus TaxID=6941 RepID=UPI003F6D2EFE
MDIVHPSYITVDDFTGEVAWIKQVVEENSVFLPMAKVTITGPFGKLVTEAAVSTSLSLQYPYKISNRSDRILRERGQKLGEGTVQALTRSKAREIASRASEKTIPMETDPGSGHRSGAQKESATDQQNEVSPTNIDEKPADRQREALSAELGGDLEGKPGDTPTSEMGSVLSPASKNFDRLVLVNRQSLAAEQDSDDSLAKLQFSGKEGIARGNVTLHKKGGLLYRHYRDKRGRVLDQLVVPRKYCEDLLNLCHGNGWSGYLGINKTKERLLMEYYWPGCFKEVEQFVRTCDTCQRTEDLSVSVYFKCAPLVSDDVCIPDKVRDVRVLDNLLDSVERYCEKKARQQEDKVGGVLRLVLFLLDDICDDELHDDERADALIFLKEQCKLLTKKSSGMRRELEVTRAECNKLTRKVDNLLKVIKDRDIDAGGPGEVGATAGKRNFEKDMHVSPVTAQRVDHTAFIKSVQTAQPPLEQQLQQLQLQMQLQQEQTQSQLTQQLQQLQSQLFEVESALRKKPHSDKIKKKAYKKPLSSSKSDSVSNHA